MRFLCTLTSLLLATCLAIGCQSAEMTRELGGPDTLRVLRTATNVSVYCVLGQVEDRIDPSPGAPRVAGYRIVAGPVQLDPAAAHRLTSTLLDPDTYEFDFYPLCMFNPGYVARVTTADGQTLDFAFCFGCMQMAMTRPPNDILTLALVGIAPGSDRLLSQLRSAFPGAATHPTSRRTN